MSLRNKNLNKVIGNVSIIVPAYKEALNIRPLCERVFSELKNNNLYGEMIIVDDNSPDDTVNVVQSLQKEGYNIKVEVRVNERGLSSAVVHGFKHAQYDTLLVMDADLQHDPIYVPSVILPILKNEADFVVGSRNVDGGGIEDWSCHRRLISKGATLLAAPLTTCTDPMSGFFALPRRTFLKYEKQINAVGFKIGLELMVRCHCQNVKDVPIVFRDREQGESKLSMKQNILYLVQLISLYIYKYPIHILIFILFILTSLIYVYIKLIS